MARVFSGWRKCHECGKKTRGHSKPCSICGAPYLTPYQRRKQLRKPPETYTISVGPINGREYSPEEYLENMLAQLGFVTGASPSTVGTPARFIKYLREFMRPFDVKELLGDGFDSPADHGIHGMVVQSHIPFRMACEHHLLPAFGRAAIGYVPHRKVVGLSKLTRLVQGFGTERPTLQELLTEKIADALVEHLEVRGAIVTIFAEHSCMGCRGINAPGVITSTSAIRGIFRDVPAAREEFFSILARAKDAHK